MQLTSHPEGGLQEYFGAVWTPKDCKYAPLPVLVVDGNCDVVMVRRNILQGRVVRA